MSSNPSAEGSARLFQRKMLQTYANNLGVSVMLWAYVEYLLDTTVKILFRFPGEDIEDEVPRAFKRKTRFLRKGFRTSLFTQEVGDRGCALLDRADELAQRRNDIVHAIVDSEVPDSFKRSVQKYRYEKESLHVEYAEVGPGDLEKLCRDIRALGDDLLTFTTFWMENFRSHLQAREVERRSRDSSHPNPPIPKA